MIYKVYADKALNVLYIEGVDYGACADYSIEQDGDKISIYRKSQSVYMIKGIDFGNLVDQNDLGFTSSDECFEYLVSLTVASFPLRFTVDYPLRLNSNVVDIDDQFINTEIYMTDGGHF